MPPVPTPPTPKPPAPGGPHPPAAPEVTAPAATLDFDATLTAIEAIIPQLLLLLEMIRAMGHAVPPPTPPPPPPA